MLWMNLATMLCETVMEIQDPDQVCKEQDWPFKVNK